MKMVGLENLKREQQEAIQEFANGKDVFVSLPTGYRKSYCYALPCIHFYVNVGAPTGLSNWYSSALNTYMLYQCSW